MDIIVDDEITKQNGSYFKEEYEKFSDCLDKYISILEEVKKSGIISGEVSDALDEFIIQVKAYTSQGEKLVLTNGKQYEQYCDNFFADLDKADGVLY